MRRFLCLFYRFPGSDRVEFFEFLQKMCLVGVAITENGVLHAKIFAVDIVSPNMLIAKERG